MRYAIVADIHGNLEAFIEVKKQLKKENIDKYICLGDIVGYGANPKECIELSKRLFDIIIAGNHDWASCGLFDVKYFNPYAREAVLWTQNVINEEEKNFLRSLPLTCQVDNFEIVHGSLHHPDEFNYILSVSEALKTFKLMKTQICFIGHSHAPVILSKDDKNEIKCINENEVKLENNLSYIINVGSVGQPRDGNPKSSYCIYDTDKKMIKIKRIAYPVAVAGDKIIKAGLPPFLAVRLSAGR